MRRRQYPHNRSGPVVTGKEIGIKGAHLQARVPRITSTKFPTILMDDSRPCGALGLSDGRRLYPPAIQAVGSLIDDRMTLARLRRDVLRAKGHAL